LNEEKSELNEEKSELNEEKSELDEETIKHQDSIENFTALNDQLITKDINKFRQQTEKLERQLNEETGKYQELLQNINAENKETIINDITNDNPFNNIQFNEPIINTNCEIDSIFITVKATISPGISDTSYIEVEKLQKLLINRKDDIDHILELQPVAKPLDITVLECLETIFENQFNIIYKIVTPLNEDNNQNLNNSKEFDDNIIAEVDPKPRQDFRIGVKLWANYEDTLKYNIDVNACGIGELLNNKCPSLNKIGFGYILQSIKVQVSPLPNDGGDLFDLERCSQPTQLNQNVEFLVGSEMNINGNIGISRTDITGGYKKNNNTKYFSREWEFNYKGPIDKGEYWLYERNKNLDKKDSTYAPGVHSGEWFVKDGMHGFCITITQVLRYEITHWWHKIPLNMKTSLQKFPMMAHNLEVTFNDLNDFNNKFKKLIKSTTYDTDGDIINTSKNNWDVTGMVYNESKQSDRIAEHGIHVII
ncbi:7833_t:CDS:2, partial [Rhizophagus irregularis]